MMNGHLIMKANTAFLVFFAPNECDCTIGCATQKSKSHPSKTRVSCHSYAKRHTNTWVWPWWTHQSLKKNRICKRAMHRWPSPAPTCTCWEKPIVRTPYTDLDAHFINWISFFFRPKNMRRELISGAAQSALCISISASVYAFQIDKYCKRKKIVSNRVSQWMCVCLRMFMCGLGWPWW